MTASCDHEAQLARIRGVLGAHRLPANTETELQIAVGTVLTDLGIGYEREARLDDRSRIDFLTSEGVGIEVKIGGGRREIWRQCQRYARLPQISALLLVGTVAMPSSLVACEGKPFRVASVGRGWL